MDDNRAWHVVTSSFRGCSAASSSASSRGHVVVVGAGPAGVTAAMHLAGAGYSVDVLERRGHPGHAVADMKRTYLIGLGIRLGAVGVDFTLPKPSAWVRCYSGWCFWELIYSSRRHRTVVAEQ